jgi:hypothetical protein
MFVLSRLAVLSTSVGVDGCWWVIVANIGIGGHWCGRRKLLHLPQRAVAHRRGGGAVSQVVVRSCH